MLEGLGVPIAFRETLLSITTVDELLDAADVPIECREKVLEEICPILEVTPPQDPIQIATISDLVDQRVAATCGPIVASRGAGLGTVAASAEEAEARKSEAGPDSGSSFTTATRQETLMKPYTGNTSKAIAKDARYTAKLDGTIQLIYYVGNDERALLTTDKHTELVHLVNAAKRHGGGSQDGGGFIINEYRHVLVPTQSGDVLHAGTYTRDLEFEFEGRLISPVAPPDIRPGDEWPGPHVGVRYTLAADATDIRYDIETTRGTRRSVKLTAYHSEASLAGLLLMFRAVKPRGGAVYVNEARETFAPVDDGGGYKRRYIGHLGDKPWFPEPS
jgi:hypothetical protein